MTKIPPTSEISDVFLRAGLFRTLAQAFSYPDEGMTIALKEAWSSQLLFWKNGLPNGVCELLATALEDLQNSSVPDLAEAHVRLFGPAARCPLTETSWGDAARLLGKPAQIADIAGFYRAFGIQPADGPDTAPEDHLAAELEFASILCLKEAWALNARLEEQLLVTCEAYGKFLEEHLATWVDIWAAQLEDENPLPFYKSLATLLQGVLRSECDRLGLMPQAIQARARDHEVGEDALACPRALEP